jgi:hypothetical protein
MSIEIVVPFESDWGSGNKGRLVNELENANAASEKQPHPFAKSVQGWATQNLRSPGLRHPPGWEFVVVRSRGSA